MTTYLLTFREGLEAALIIGILLATLRMLKAERYNIFVWGGAAIGVVLSFVFAWLFQVIVGGFEGITEKIYEGVLMLVAVALITHLIFWLGKKGKEIQKKLQQKIEFSIKTGSLWAIGFLSMMSVFREGVEVVIFFQALMAQSEGSISLLAPMGGILSAVVLAILIFKFMQKISLKFFFEVTVWFLGFVAAGLLAHGIVELQGAGVIPVIQKPLFDLSWFMSEKEGLGAFLKAGFGYDANPSLLAFGGYIFYLFCFLYFKTKKY